MTPDALKASLCGYFCEDLSVRETPDGMAISSSLNTDCGDRIAFVMTSVSGGYILEDDGDFLSTLDARGIEIGTGTRRQFITGILSQAGAYWDSDTFIIKTNIIPKITPQHAIRFMTALIRIRDIKFWNREAIQSTFKEDVTAEIQEKLAGKADIRTHEPIDSSLAEFPADIIVNPNGDGVKTAIYLINSNDGVSEALALWQEAQRINRHEFKVMAIIEDDASTIGVNKKKFHRMANRIDSVAYYRGDERATMDKVCRITGIH